MITVNGEAFNINGGSSPSFFGYSAATPFSTVSISLTDPNGFAATIDNFSFGVPNFSGVVPEFATWAMMMLGFGGLGFAMRRKNKVSTRIRFA